jgi:very-short-patch-repair endonuclease
MTTVSVIVGESPHVLCELADIGLRAIASRALDAREMAVDYLAQASPASLRDVALAELAPDLNIRPEWEHKSHAEQALWLEQAQARPLSIDAAFAIQWLQQRDSDPVARVALLTQWRPLSELPMLVLSGTPRALEQAVALANAASQLAVAFVIEEAALAEALDEQRPRTRALLQDAIVRAPRERQVAQEPPRAGARVERAPPRTEVEHIDEPASDWVNGALREPALNALHEEARMTQRLAREDASQDAPTQDRARSMVERFLYELLRRSHVTRGLFELNALLPFRFGARRLEADFAARSLRVVLEVDGYFHFTNLDAYRRDRRKDLLLQQQGYLVARFLAADVLERTAGVIGQIERLVIVRKDP